jgi:transcriptional regulator with XRE-family HTH domain
MDETPEMIEARADSLVSDHEDLLRKLVAHRKHHHLSQEVVAERMGVSQPTVAKFERYDSNPTLSTIRRYALAVGARLHTEVHDDCTSHTEWSSTRKVDWPTLMDSPEVGFRLVTHFRDEARHRSHWSETSQPPTLAAIEWSRSR